MKNKLAFLSALAVFVFVTVAVAAPQLAVSISGDYVLFQKQNKYFVAAVEQPKKCLAVHVLYPKRDFSEYVLTPDLSVSLYKEDLWGYYHDRRANDTEWKQFESEWKQIQKSV